MTAGRGARDVGAGGAEYGGAAGVTAKPAGLASLARRLPPPIRGWLARLAGRTPPRGAVRFGDLRRTAPISRAFGFDRGLPVDRWYIERFLAEHAEDVRGRVLEVGDDGYTRRFGGARVVQCDILHVDASNPKATIVADLADAGHVPSAQFDCIIVTQTLHLIYDVPGALGTLRRLLRPGGACLATVPGISQTDAGEWGESWYWSFTPRALERRVREAFTGEQVTVAGHGNVLAACAFLQGLAAEELSPVELAVHDPCYPLVVTCRAVRGSDG